MGYNDAAHHQQLRERFRNVIVRRGYSGTAVEGILSEWFPKYIEDIEGFEGMLSAYESNDFDPSDEQLDAVDSVVLPSEKIDRRLQNFLDKKPTCGLMLNL